MAHIDIAPAPRAPRPLDGAAGNLFARTEPKVRAAALVALLTPVVLFYANGLLAPLALPGVLVALVDALVTGVLTFAAGYLARAVDRTDLFLRPLAHQAEGRIDGAVRAVADRVLGPKLGESVVDDVESWLHTVAADVVVPVEEAATDVLVAVSDAAAAGTDPLVDARAADPGLLAALAEAQAAVAADTAAAAQRATADALAQAAADPGVLAEKLAELLALLGKPAAIPAGQVVVADPPTVAMPVIPAALAVADALVSDAAVGTVGLPPVPGSVAAA